MSRSDDAARCEGVVRIYPSASGPVSALKEVDAVVERGTITAVVGPSGSGKSTLLRLLAALDRPTAGEVLLDGQATRLLSDRQLRRLRRSRVALVLQRPSHNLFPHLTTRQHLQHAARLTRRRVASTDKLLDELGLRAQADQRPTTLSGGEQQRLAVAQAAVREPALLIADEPTAELDAAAAARLLDVLRGLRDRGQAILLSTHDPTVVAAADRTYTLRDGSVHAEARADVTLAVIDRSGRVQLPPEALERFPERRAVLRLQDDGSVRMDPP